MSSFLRWLFGDEVIVRFFIVHVILARLEMPMQDKEKLVQEGIQWVHTLQSTQQNKQRRFDELRLYIRNYLLEENDQVLVDAIASILVFFVKRG